ncbi:hypothetical protein [Sphingopyxis sp. 113P3]|uniref:hypothetical protein n=1 Tax=Sphingopyxis sp. (strain 113P3) TaxID=292913 RepID=UPI0006AD44D6|nr:hypothetical protein [Sphingopyxis sp. 113P3]ALC11200.1 hypothetical protein LH20_04465 [Sphingopyxis sp. 113P3]
MIGLLLPLATRIVGERFAKLASWAFVLLIVAAVIGGAIWWFTDTVDDAHDAGVKAGVTAERIETQGKVIENVKAANDARDAVNDPRSCAMYVECVRSARTPTNCVRYLPDHEGCAVQSGASGGR